MLFLSAETFADNIDRDLGISRAAPAAATNVFEIWRGGVVNSCTRCTMITQGKGGNIASHGHAMHHVPPAHFCRSRKRLCTVTSTPRFIDSQSRNTLSISSRRGSLTCILYCVFLRLPHTLSSPWRSWIILPITSPKTERWRSPTAHLSYHLPRTQEYLPNHHLPPNIASLAAGEPYSSYPSPAPAYSRFCGSAVAYKMVVPT